jgi:hypothetical protein
MILDFRVEESGIPVGTPPGKPVGFGFGLVLTEKKSNPVLKFLTYFCGPLPWMMLFAHLEGRTIEALQGTAR